MTGHGLGSRGSNSDTHIEIFLSYAQIKWRSYPKDMSKHNKFNLRLQSNGEVNTFLATHEICRIKPVAHKIWISFPVREVCERNVFSQVSTINANNIWPWGRTADKVIVVFSPGGLGSVPSDVMWDELSGVWARFLSEFLRFIPAIHHSTIVQWVHILSLYVLASFLTWHFLAYRVIIIFFSFVAFQQQKLWINMDIQYSISRMK